MAVRKVEEMTLPKINAKVHLLFIKLFKIERQLQILRPLKFNISSSCQHTEIMGFVW